VTSPGEMVVFVGGCMRSGTSLLHRDSGLYFNVHTPAHGGGEIRGQILLVPVPPAVWGGVSLLGIIDLRRWSRRRRAA